MQPCSPVLLDNHSRVALSVCRSRQRLSSLQPGLHSPRSCVSDGSQKRAVVLKKAGSKSSLKKAARLLILPSFTHDRHNKSLESVSLQRNNPTWSSLLVAKWALMASKTRDALFVESSARGRGIVCRLENTPHCTVPVSNQRKKRSVYVMSAPSLPRARAHSTRRPRQPRRSAA